MTANTPKQDKNELGKARDASFDEVGAFDHLDRDEIDGPPDTDDHREKESAKTERRWIIAERVTRVAASIGVAGAAIFSAMQYFAVNQSARAERSMTYVTQWQEDKIDDHFAAVQVYVEERMKPIGNSLAALDQEALDAALGNLGTLWLTENRAGPDPDALEDHLDQLTLFFGQFEICLQAKLCDKKVLYRYFNSEVDSFWTYFSHYAVLRRQDGYVNYGVGVDALVITFDKLNK